MRLTKPVFSPLALLILFCGCSLHAAEEGVDSGQGRVHLYVKASDPYEGKLTFKWCQTDGPTGKILDPVAARLDAKSKKWISETYFIPPKPGKYEFQVSVKNEDGVESKKTVIVEAVKAVKTNE